MSPAPEKKRDSTNVILILAGVAVVTFFVIGVLLMTGAFNPIV